MHTEASFAVLRYNALVVKERAKEIDAIQHATKTHEHLVDGYWEARHLAELKFRAAVALLNALEDLK